MISPSPSCGEESVAPIFGRVLWRDLLQGINGLNEGEAHDESLYLNTISVFASSLSR